MPFRNFKINPSQNCHIPNCKNPMSCLESKESVLSLGAGAGSGLVSKEGDLAPKEQELLASMEGVSIYCLKALFQRNLTREYGDIHLNLVLQSLQTKTRIISTRIPRAS